MSVTNKTARAALWSVATGVGSRLLSLGTTLILTRFLAPAAYGQVSVAFIVAAMASLASSFGIPQFVACRPQATRSELFHATVLFHTGGIAALALVWFLRTPLGVVFGAEGVEPFMAGFLVATLFERVGQIPESMLVRDMRFREAGLAGAASEVAYSLIAMALAWRGAGAQSLVLAALGRSVVKTVLFLRLTDRREWLTPCAFDRRTLKSLLGFGTPLVFARLSGVIARRGDNLAFGALFGASPLGAYNLAYNLADVPATTVGEKIGDVLVPSFAKLPPEARPAALRRALAMLALAVFPLGAGLSAVARPLSMFLDERWRALDVRWMLAILCLLSLSRPMGWAARVYLEVAGLTRPIMALEWARAAAVIAGIFSMGLLGPLAACAAVGLVFVLTSLAYVAYAARVAGLSFASLMTGQLGPLAAASVMWAAVMALDASVLSGASPGLALFVDVVAGVIAYVGAAWLFARPLVRSMIGAVQRNGAAAAPSSSA